MTVLFIFLTVCYEQKFFTLMKFNLTIYLEREKGRGRELQVTWFFQGHEDIVLFLCKSIIIFHLILWSVSMDSMNLFPLWIHTMTHGLHVECEVGVEVHCFSTFIRLFQHHILGRLSFSIEFPFLLGTSAKNSLNVILQVYVSTLYTLPLLYLPLLTLIPHCLDHHNFILNPEIR